MKAREHLEKVLELNPDLKGTGGEHEYLTALICLYITKEDLLASIAKLKKYSQYTNAQLLKVTFIFLDYLLQIKVENLSRDFIQFTKDLTIKKTDISFMERRDAEVHIYLNYVFGKSGKQRRVVKFKDDQQAIEMFNQFNNLL